MSIFWTGFPARFFFNYKSLPEEVWRTIIGGRKHHRNIRGHSWLGSENAGLKEVVPQEHKRL